MPTDFYDIDEINAYITAYTAYLQKVFKIKPSKGFKVLRTTSGVVWEIKDAYLSEDAGNFWFGGDSLEEVFKLKSCNSKKTKLVRFQNLIYEFQLVEVPKAFAVLYGPPPTLSRDRRNGQ